MEMSAGQTAGKKVMGMRRRLYTVISEKVDGGFGKLAGLLDVVVLFDLYGPDLFAAFLRVARVFDAIPLCVAGCVDMGDREGMSPKEG